MTDIAIQLRPAAPEDMTAILALWGEMMSEHERQDPRIRLTGGALPAYRAYLGYHLTTEESLVQVAEIPGQGVIGFCMLTVNRNLPMFLPANYGYLSDLVVGRPWRRLGIGRALVREGIHWLRQRGLDSIQLQYYCFNQDGAAFWRAMGFESYYTRMWLDMNNGS